jgi:hypothetical protein
MCKVSELMCKNSVEERVITKIRKEVSLCSVNGQIDYREKWLTYHKRMGNEILLKFLFNSHVKGDILTRRSFEISI